MSFAIAFFLTTTSMIRMPDICHRSSRADVKHWLRQKGFWANLAHISGPVISFVVLIPQWNYMCNQFAFTFDQSNGFMLFFAAGATWGALGSDLTLGCR